MERAFKIGCSVIFFDSHREPHEALVTNWFHGGRDGQTVEEYLSSGTNWDGGPRTSNMLPCCNVVWVSSDKDKSDPYGRQLERQTSCTYGRSQGPHPFLGMSWCWPDELEEALKLAAEAYKKSVAK